MLIVTNREINYGKDLGSISEIPKLYFLVRKAEYSVLM